MIDQRSKRADVAVALLTVADVVALAEDKPGRDPEYANHVCETVRQTLGDALDGLHIPTYAEWAAINRLLSEPSGEAPDLDTAERRAVIA